MIENLVGCMSAIAAVSPAAQKSCRATSKVTKTPMQGSVISTMHNISERVKMHTYKLLPSYDPLKT